MAKPCSQPCLSSWWLTQCSALVSVRWPTADCKTLRFCPRRRRVRAYQQVCMWTWFVLEFIYFVAAFVYLGSRSWMPWFQLWNVTVPKSESTVALSTTAILLVFVVVACVLVRRYYNKNVNDTKAVISYVEQNYVYDWFSATKTSPKCLLM